MDEKNSAPLARDEENEVKQHRDYKSEIVDIIRSNFSPKVLQEKILNYHENDIAESLALLSKDERSRLYNILDAQTLADVLEYTEDDLGTYFSELSIRKKLEILSNLEPDTALEYLRKLSKGERETLIDLMDDDSKKEIALIGSFDEDEIGSKMSTNYIAIKTGIGIRDAMRELVSQAEENDNIQTIYVIDDYKTFYGAIDLKDLIRAREGRDTVDDIVITSYPYVYAHEEIDSCIERIKDYSEDSIPVLDNDNKLLGVVTSQDLIEIVDEEMGEDYAKFAGLSAEEDIKEPVKTSMKKRLPWLVILLFLGLGVSSIVNLFAHVEQELTILVAFQSLVLDMAGNVGTQSLGVTLRDLMDESLTSKQKAKLCLKECRIGFSNGVVLGIGSFAFIGLFIMLVKGRPAHEAFAISACIGVSLLISMVLSSLAGTGIPIFFKKIGVDPAVASGPLITTINDLIAVATYYGLSWILLLDVMGLAN